MDLMNKVKLEYVKSLSLDDVRFELDKIYARRKEIEQLKGLRFELDNDFFISDLSILDKDLSKLDEEHELYSYYYNYLLSQK